ncbi:MAG: cell division protein FtsQ/DivIB [Kordiimonadaceae bacterium]|nr:cell division protein FtsQ/DivIB [Kordiimonadaceae bacterium]
MNIALRYQRILLLFGALLSAASFYYMRASEPAAGWFLETSGRAGFVLSNVEITGLGRTTKNDVLARLDVDNGMPILGIDLESIQARVEALPWVRHAVVSRVFPGDLRVQVEERQPYALWQNNGSVGLIDMEGVVITRRGLDQYSELLMIVGEEGPATVGALFLMLESNVELAGRVKTAIRVGDRRWDMVFDNGVRVKLPEEMDAKYNASQAWQRFVSIQQKHSLLEREVSVIDMRIADRIVMRVTPAGRHQLDVKRRGKEWIA